MKKITWIAGVLIFSVSSASSNPLGAEKDLDLKGNTPLKDGINAWFYGLNTALGGNKYIGDVVDQNSIFHNYKGDLVNLHRKSDESIEDYENTHNHYQNLFVQTINKVENVNAVSVWGGTRRQLPTVQNLGEDFSAQDPPVLHMLKELLYRNMATPLWLTAKATTIS